MKAEVTDKGNIRVIAETPAEGFTLKYLTAGDTPQQAFKNFVIDFNIIKKDPQDHLGVK